MGEATGVLAFMTDGVGETLESAVFARDLLVYAGDNWWGETESVTAEILLLGIGVK